MPQILLPAAFIFLWQVTVHTAYFHVKESGMSVPAIVPMASGRNPVENCTGTPCLSEVPWMIHYKGRGVSAEPFIGCWLQSTPSAAGAMFFFYTNHLGFSPEFVGRIKLLDGIAQLLGEG